MLNRYWFEADPGVLAIIVRHARTQLNDPSNPMVRGWQDAPLADDGKIQAQITANKLKQYDPKFIYHSDFMRDSETATILSDTLHIPTEADFDSRTWDVGVYSGKPEAIANPPLLELYKQSWLLPPGSTETFDQFTRRWCGFLDRKLNVAAQIPQMRPVIIVTHGRNVALTQSYLENSLPWKAEMPMPAGYAVIEIQPDKMLTIDFQGKTESVIADV